jgi:uncharacterized OB-fold protein
MTEQPAEPAQKPVPAPDEESQPFFNGAKRGVLMLRRCNACSASLHPATETCTECLSDDLTWSEASGRGTLHSFGLMHQNYHPAFTDKLPYNLAVVELDEGPRFNSNVVGIENDALTVGMALEVIFEQYSDEISLPKFRPAS